MYEQILQLYPDERRKKKVKLPLFTCSLASSNLIYSSTDLEENKETEFLPTLRHAFPITLDTFDGKLLFLF